MNEILTLYRGLPREINGRRKKQFFNKIGVEFSCLLIWKWELQLRFEPVDLFHTDKKKKIVHMMIVS